MTAFIQLLQILTVTLGLSPGYMAAPAPAQPPARSAVDARNHFTLLAGASRWPAIGALRPEGGVSDPAGFGKISATGYALELGWQRRLPRTGPLEVRAGADLGFFFHPNSKTFDTTLLASGRVLRSSINARGMYLTPSLRFLSGRAGGTRFSVGAGAGWYLVDIVEQTDDGMEAAQYYQDGAFGGWFSAGVQVPFSRSRPAGPSFAAEFKAHAFDLARPGSFAPGGGEIGPPLYTLQAGIIF